ncbi:transmembrane 9 superfamily member 7-like isoform X1 [Salvia splendens]|uniref:transmembrane 9 superfamily member 7-like isoform X1 n=1 Tax=Salvia splendens TaxID=180675 RepID=UPI001C2675E1|nr:transmembrane 9 superfamily member 7-like isoform X1 [Salvia splendens]
MYHRDEEANSARIVGFEVTPKSIKHEIQWDYTNRLNVSTSNNSTRYMFEEGGVSLQEVYAGADIIFSYDVVYKGDELQVKVNKLFSAKTLLPYDYYYLKNCRPPTIRDAAQNFGQVLRGDRTSVYTFHMREEQSCTVTCRIVLSAQDAKDFKEKIDDDYRAYMILDDLPVVVRRKSLDGSRSTVYQHGFEVGFKALYAGTDEVYSYYITNHLSFKVMYHRGEEANSARIVGFEVTPNSIKHEVQWDYTNRLNVSTCNNSTRYLFEEGGVSLQEVYAGADIIFSYDVVYKESEIEWASRWDAYLLINDGQIHWFSIANSLLIMLFFCGTVATIMIRTLRKGIASYDQLESKDEAHEEMGWKLLHGDVFRPPLNLEVVCACAGSGLQMLGTTLATMIFALLGCFSYFNHGWLMTAMVLLWLLMSFFGGYSSARLQKMFKTTDWKRSGLKTALLLPGIVLSVFFAVRTLIWGEMLSSGIPFGTVLALSILWFGVSGPLVFLGGYFGNRKTSIEALVETCKIPRKIPKQRWYLRPIFSILMAGILPFVSVLIEARFIQTYLLMNQLCFMFGFLLAIFVVLMILCAEIAVVFCYLQLCSEDYNWWWRAFLNGGSPAFYLFVYSVFFLFTKWEIIIRVCGIWYAGYIFIVLCAVLVVTGSVGFYACLWFVRMIYSSVKIE